jgi:hypothetical protein
VNSVIRVPADSIDGFVYTPTSGNCFRRDALRLVLREHALANLKHHADAYINRAVCLMSGVALIDAPLTIYRIHGENGFVAHPELSGVRNYSYWKCFRAEHVSWKAVVDLLFNEAPFFIEKVGAERFTKMLAVLQATCPWDGALEFEDLRGYIDGSVERHGDALARLIPQGRVAPKGATVFRNDPTGGRRRMAELFLTLGRLLRSHKLTDIGNAIWKA